MACFEVYPLTPADLPLLVLLPGMDGTGRLFASLCRALDGRVDYVVLTYPDAGSQSYESLTRALLPDMPASRPYVLVAESFGGPLAILLVSKAAQPPLGLCLTATFAHNPMPPFGVLWRHWLPLFIRCASAELMIAAVLVRPGDHALAAETAGLAHRLELAAS